MTNVDSASNGNSDVEELAVNTIRMLSAEAVETAQCGHPGMPMGAAPMGYALWSRHLRHNPANPGWLNRDRFVLSAGHGSMLLYSLLHLSGYDLPVEELRRFRQWGSRTPGHPEYGHTAGVDATTGPLGQGLAMAVGMAMAEAHLAAVYNRERLAIVDHHTYVICGDGDLMEGVSYEAASLAGHLKLGKLIVLYDSNGISLDGELGLSFSDQIRPRFEGMGWHYLRVERENDLDSISAAIESAKSESTRPSIIEVKTTIGFGSPNKAGLGGEGGPHGVPLGREEIRLTKEALRWPLYPDFYVPDPVKARFAKLKVQGEQANRRWDEAYADYRLEYPELAEQLEQAVRGELLPDWDALLKPYAADHQPISTRAASGEALNRIALNVPALIGGSADVESSTCTHLEGSPPFSADDYGGRNIYFGVREFAMAAAINGLQLHGGLKAYGGAFFVFSDYLRPAMRLAAIMQLPVIFVLTHDSIAVGEDGPTHQPIEQLAALRAMPNVTVVRPADGNETIEAWRAAMMHKRGPVCLVLSRQPLPIAERTMHLARAGVRRGAYVLSDPAGIPAALVLASGSEVHLALEAQKALVREGISVRVVSMPSWELFERQPKAYRDSVLPPGVKARLAVEMAHPQGWERYVGDHGAVMGIESFGASGKRDVAIEEFGFTVQKVVERVKSLL